MRSKTVIVEDEKQEDFDELAAGWRREYDDDGQATKSLLERVILNDWFLRRAERRYMGAEEELAAVKAMDWTEEQHHKIELYLRYKTTNERSFYRALNSLRGLRKDRMKEVLDLENMKEKMDTYAVEALKNASEKAKPEAKVESAAAGRGKEIFQGQNHPKKQRKIAVLDQWVEVEMEEGRTVTKLYPSNAGLIEEGKKMYPPPEMVYRKINFPDGIPHEYAWASSDPRRFERGGMGTQRMTVDTWLEVIEREAARGTGHVGPTGVGNLPRPKERGGCDCEVCTRNREVVGRRAANGSEQD